MDLITRKPKNAAAWQLDKNKRPVVVDSAPYTSPPEGFVSIRVVDVAVNPIDWKMQDNAVFDVDYPAIFGIDIAGEVVEVGKGVKEYRVGQRVIANCDSYGTNDPTHGAFQRYVVVRREAIAELPYSIPTSKGVVLPLGITTASAGLYQKGYLSLPFPTTKKDDKDKDGDEDDDDDKSTPNDKDKDKDGKDKDDKKDKKRTILVWGGSSSVGSSAIQLAVASDIDVITTASPKNFEYCRALGARQCFDYHSDDVVDQIVRALKGKMVAGAFDAVSGDAGVQCARVLDKIEEGKAIVVSVGGVPEKEVPKGVRVKNISSGTIFDNDVGPYIWREFLPKALEKGVILPKPDAQIVGEDLRSIQAGLDAQRKGVSASKIVVTNISS